MPPTRRDLMRVAGGLGAVLLAPSSAAGLLTPARAAAAPPPRADDDLPFRISLAQWSLHRALRSGALDPLDFPRHAAERHDIHAVEYVNTFFQDKATDFRWLEELRRRAEFRGVRSLLIMIDAEGYLAVNDAEARRASVENHFRWIAAAHYLGCHSIRVNAAGDGTPDEQREAAVDSLRRLGDMGERYDINVIVENHGGISSNGAWLASVMTAAAHPRVGTLPDFGNFRLAGDEWYDRYQGVAEMMPFAKAVSAKSHDFDEAGEEAHTDYHRMLGIVLDAGYHGHLGIEYEGDGLSEDDGITATKTLLERVRAERSAR